MKIRWSAVTLLVFSVVGYCTFAESKAPHPSEQLVFSAEEPQVKRPVALPQDVLGILKKDKMVHNALEDAGVPPEKMPLSWFSASEIHLSNSSRVDLVVVAKDVLLGANVTTFWVFRSTGQGHELVLSAPAHSLAIKNMRWRGYRDIELASASAVQFSSVLCRFDGKKYAPYKTLSEPIR